MKVLYVLTDTNVHSGATKSFITLLKGCLNNGIECTVVVPDDNGIYVTLKNMGVKVFYVPYKNTILPPFTSWKDRMMFLPLFIKKQLDNYLGYRSLLKICKKYTPDIIHTNTTITNIGYSCSRKLCIPHVWHVREYGDIDFGFRDPFKQRRLLHKNNYRIVITKDIARHLGIENSLNTVIIYNGIQIKGPSYPNNGQSVERGNFFLYAGRLELGKGILELLNAYNEYVNKVVDPLNLYVAGDGILKNAVIDFVNKHSLNNKVRLLGSVDNIVDYMKIAKAVVVPSLSEGFGRVMAEAMFSRCIVIGNNTGGTKEQFDNGVELTGAEIGFRYNNNKELVSIMQMVSSSDEKFLDLYRGRASDVVNKLYTPEVYVREVNALYDRITETN